MRALHGLVTRPAPGWDVAAEMEGGRPPSPRGRNARPSQGAGRKRSEPTFRSRAPDLLWQNGRCLTT